MSPSGWVSYFGAAASQIIDVASQCLGATVPSCPDWAGRDLVAHIATRPAVWSVLMSADPGGGFPPIDLEQLQGLVPPDDDALVSWAHESVSAYAERLQGLDPATRAWSYAPDGTVGFWMRRATLEAAVHSWDAQGLAGGRGAVPTALAADGLDELVVTYPVRFSIGGGAEVRPLAVRATDTDGTWTLCPPGASMVVEHEVRGAAGDLFLRLWGRDVGTAFSGDVAVLDEWAALAKGMG
jgi:uncharacterized protein (TIGR03083 family)